MIKPKTISFVAFVFLLILTGCKKEEDVIFNQLTFPAEVIFGKLNDKADLVIGNASGKTLAVRLIFNEVVNYRNEIESNQILEAGGTLTLSLSLNRLLVDDELYSMNIEIHIATLGTAVQVPVLVHSALPQSFSLDYNITDAVYDETGNRILAISSRPENALLKIDPSTGEMQKIKLNSRPLSLYVNNQLQKVVIGQADRFSVIDLSTGVIVRERQTEFGINPVIMPDEKWIYAIRCDYGNFYKINLETDEVIYAGYTGPLKMELHPHLKNGILSSIIDTHPSTLDVYDASEMPENKLYSSLRVGDTRDIYDNFWITNDKKWIVSRGKCVFTCSADRNADLQYVKVLFDGKLINSMVHLSNYGKIITISRQRLWFPDENLLVIYDDSELDILGKFPLPETNYNPGEEAYSEGFFAFTDNAQKNLAVLVASSDVLSEDNKWTLLIYKTDDIFNE